MRIFITGASGLIGTSLVKRLIGANHTLVCLIRPQSNLKYLHSSGATLVEGDIRDKASLLEGMKGCDWVVHLADFHSAWAPHKSIYTDVNTTGTRNIMECVLEAGVSKVVSLSTALIFDDTPKHAYNLPKGKNPTQISEYLRTKRAGDMATWHLHREKGLPLVMLYTGNVIGPDDKNPNGQHIRNLIFRRVPFRSFDDVITTYVSVGDVAEAILKVLENKSNIGEKYLIGKSQYSLGEYNKIVSKVSGVPLAKIRIPGFMAVFGAHLFTILADITRKPPIFGISIDALRVARAGLVFDGSEAEKLLALNYTSIETALKEAVESYKAKPH
jgi:dihydroflavonol-4-reductase